MTNYSIPKKQGLYDPAFEHDACGMGFVVNIKGEKSHDIIDEALTILENLSHRGASGADENTGDGAGIMVQIPHEFFKRECDVLGFELPEKGGYGVGMIFAHRYDDFRKTQMETFEKIVREEGQKILGWREVPIDKTQIGETARAVMPRFIQVLLKRIRTLRMSWILSASFMSSAKERKRQLCRCVKTRAARSMSPAFPQKLSSIKGC